MSNKIIYYAIVGGGATVDRPQGLVRRLEHDDGPDDEALHQDGGWHWSSLIVEYEHGSTDANLVLVSHEQASKIVEYLREKYAGGNESGA